MRFIRMPRARRFYQRIDLKRLTCDIFPRRVLALGIEKNEVVDEVDFIVRGKLI